MMREAPGLMSVLLLVALLAGASADLVRFDVDQDVHFAGVQAMIDGAAPALVGTTNAWLHMGPLEYYVFLPIQLLSSDPVWSLRFSVFLFLLGLLALYDALGSLRVPPALSRAVVLLAGFDHFLIWMARDTTHLSLFFPAAALVFAGLLRHENRPGGRGFPLALVGALLALQAHLSAVLLLPLPALAAARRFPRPARPHWWLLPLFVLVLTLCPWLIHQWNSGFSDVLQRIEQQGSGQTPEREIRPLLARVFSPAEHGRGLSPDEDGELLRRLPFLRWRGPWLQMLVLLALIVCLTELRPGRRDGPLLLLLASFALIPPLLVAFAPQDHARYMLILHPLVWLLLGRGLAPLFPSDRPRRRLYLLLFLPALFFQFSWNLGLRQQMSRSGTVHGDLTLRSKQAVIAELARHGFTRQGFCDRFIALHSGENGGWRWLARSLPPGDAKDGTGLAVLLPDEAAAGMPFRLAFLPAALKIKPRLRQDSAADSRASPATNDAPLYLEGPGQTYDLDISFELEATRELQLCLKTRAWPYRLVLGDGRRRTRPVKRQRWRRETLPDIHLLALPPLPPGRHSFGLRIYLGELWTSLQATLLPAEIPFPRRPPWYRWDLKNLDVDSKVFRDTMESELLQGGP